MRIMRALLAVSIGLAVAPACASAPGCSYPRLVPVAAVGGALATSCVAGVVVGEDFFTPSCRPVRAAFLGEVLARGDRSFEVYVMRAITGVDPARAAAVRTLRPNDPSYTRAVEADCGRWQLYVADVEDLDAFNRVTKSRPN